MLPALLARIGLPILIQSVSGALDKMTNPLAKTASDALKQVNDAVAKGAISPDEIKESNRHLEKMSEFESAEIKTQIEQINASLRAEIASEDPYVRRMRPTYGYVLAFTWAIQMLAVATLILENPDKAIVVMNAMGNLDTIWTVGLSVLGIYVYKRSKEKLRA